MASERWWRHEQGSEYVVANLVKTPGLYALLKRVETASASYAMWNRITEKLGNSSGDLFTTLSMEMISMVVKYLSSKDIADLRLTTRAVRQLPDILFRRLLLKGMP